MKLLSQGAEAKILDTGKAVVKHRFRKRYRIAAIDDMLRRSRTRREVKVLQKLQELGVPVPAVLKSSDKTMKVTMEKISGKQLRDEVTAATASKYFRQAGAAVAKMHDAGIVHGDLTTSNILVREKKLVFIDFGLSVFSRKVEDFAVDIHVLKETISAKHPQIAKRAWSAFLKGYERKRDAAAVLQRLEKVEARGRYKGK